MKNRVFILGAILVLSIILNSIFFHLDNIDFLKLWGLILIYSLGPLAFIPLTLKLELPPSFSKVIFFIIPSAITYIIISIFSLWVVPVYLTVLLTIVGSSFYLCRPNLKQNFKINEVLEYEIIFLALLFTFLVFNCWGITFQSGEKMMDMSFISYFLNEKSSPLYDPWFYGHKGSYYALGYFMFVLPAKIVSLPNDLTYTAGMGILSALMGISIFSLITREYKEYNNKLRAFVATLFVLLLPNLKTILSLGEKRNFSNFWGVTRIFRDNLFAEFPIWSLLFADLHPHVIGMVIIPLYLALLLSQIGKKDQSIYWPLILLTPIIILTNAWDMMFLMGVTGLFFVVYRTDKTFKLALSSLLSTLFFTFFLVFIFPRSGEDSMLRLSEKGNTYSALLLQFGPFLIPLSFVIYKREKKIFVFFLSCMFLIFIGEVFVLHDEINSYFKTYTFSFYLSSLATAFLVIRYKTVLYLLTPFLLLTTIWLFLGIKNTSDEPNLRFMNGEWRKHNNIDWHLADTLVAYKNKDMFLMTTAGESYDYKVCYQTSYSGIPCYLGWRWHVFARGIPSSLIEERSEVLKEFNFDNGKNIYLIRRDYLNNLSKLKSLTPHVENVMDKKLFIYE